MLARVFLFSEEKLLSPSKIMFSRLNRIKKSPQQDTLVTADELVFPDSTTLDYFLELIGGFIHKHNNFLTVSQGFSQLLMADAHNDSVAKSAETIQRSAQKAIDLNARMTACTAMDSPKLSEFDFFGFLEKRGEKEKRRAIANSVDFEVEFSGPSGSVRADPAWLGIILDEILENAYDAVKKRPSRKVVIASSSASPLESDSTRFKFLEIRDNGGGVSEEKLRSVFRPFFTTKSREHLGIGLTRAGVLAGIMGVRLGIDSSESGTVVHLALPSS